MQMNTGQISNIYRSLLYKKQIAPINIGSTQSNSWYNIELNNITKPLLSISYIEQPEQSFLNYQIYFINNPISFTETAGQFPKYIPKVLFFHDSTMLNMKKEDAYILNDKIKSFPKYSFMSHISEIVSDVKIIKYGFYQEDNETLLSKRSRSVLFCCEPNNLNSVIFSNIKKLYPDAELLTHSEQQTNIGTILKEYKIFLNLSPHSYNTLLAASKGCTTISLKEEHEIPNHKTIKSMEEIQIYLSNILNDFSDDSVLDNSNAICKLYPYDIFINTIEGIVNTTLK